MYVGYTQAVCIIHVTRVGVNRLKVGLFCGLYVKNRRSDRMLGCEIYVGCTLFRFL